MAAGEDGREAAGRDRATSLFAPLIARARIILLWERVWPKLAPVLAIAGLFVAASWFGLFEGRPAWMRLSVLALFVAAALAALLPFLRLAWPSRRDGLARLDRDLGVPHRPLSALADQQATSPGDPVSRALWAAHQREAEAKARDLRLEPPSPGLPARDPYALRLALILLVVVGFFYAGGERGARLLSAFRAPAALAQDNPARIDAWVTPPAYTRRPPVLLSAAGNAGQVLSVPQDSALVVRVAGDPSAEIGMSGGALEAAAAPPSAPAAAPSAAGSAGSVVEKRLTLKDDATIT